jgi:hypothetical protein
MEFYTTRPHDFNVNIPAQIVGYTPGYTAYSSAFLEDRNRCRFSVKMEGTIH